MIWPLFGLVGIGIGVFALASKKGSSSGSDSGSTGKSCGRVVLTAEVMQRVVPHLAELLEGLTPESPAVELIRRLLNRSFPSCSFSDDAEATIANADGKGGDLTWKQVQEIVRGKTIAQINANNPFVVVGASSTVGPEGGPEGGLGELMFIAAVALSGPQTAPMPQGKGSYIGDPKGFTTWPGQDILPNQAAIGRALNSIGYDVGNPDAPGFSLISNPAYNEVGDFQSDWNRYKLHYQGTWAPSLGEPDHLLGNNSVSALAGVIRNNLDWVEILATLPVEPPPSVNGGSKKALLWRMLEALPELNDAQRKFIMLVAYGETGGSFRSTAHNDTASEVAASVAAWDNNPSLATKLVNCGHGGKAAWAIGSGGYGGRLGPYFGNDMLRGGLTCSPSLLFEPKHSLLSSLITAWALQQQNQWKASAKTAKNLRAGYYGLAYMRNPPADRIAKYRKHSAAVGFSPDFVDQVIPTFPSPNKAKTMLARLANIA